MYLVTAPPSSATDENQPPKAEVWVRSGIYLYVKIPPKSRCIQIVSLNFFRTFSLLDVWPDRDIGLTSGKGNSSAIVE